jgi:hypothetical protein
MGKSCLDDKFGPFVLQCACWYVRCGIYEQILLVLDDSITQEDAELDQKKSLIALSRHIGACMASTRIITYPVTPE